jgi:hypothetical protein
MNKKEAYDELAFLLYLMPFIVSAIYAIILWVNSGISFFLPESIYLSVTKNPYVFMIGFFSVLIGVVIEVINREPSQRREAVFTLSKRLQSIAIISFTLSFITAWYTKGFLDLGSAILNLLDGRYTLIFPAFVLLISFLILPIIRIERKQIRNVSAAISLLAVPLAIYGIGRWNVSIGLITSLILITLGVYFSFTNPSSRDNQG